MHNSETLGRGGKGRFDPTCNAIKMPPTVILGLVPRTHGPARSQASNLGGLEARVRLTKRSHAAR
jgi:hypothetical protein